MWDKFKKILEKAPASQGITQDSSAPIDWRSIELRTFLSHTGRIPFEIARRAAQELSSQAFAEFFTCPVLAGSAVLPGSMWAATPGYSGSRKRKSTLLFKPSDLLEPSTDSEPLQKAIYPLVKEASNSDPKMNLFAVGRSAANNLVIPDFAVSERHASIELTKGYYILSDWGSTNCTKVGGVEISAPHQLKDGDILTFGRLDFHFLSSQLLYQHLRAHSKAK